MINEDKFRVQECDKINKEHKKERDNRGVNQFNEENEVINLCNIGTTWLNIKINACMIIDRHVIVDASAGK